MFEYGIQLSIPSDIDDKLRTWAERIGTTWSPWGGHITLISRFSLHTGSQSQIETILEDLCHTTEPMKLSLDKAVVDAHLTLPNMMAVMLIESETNPVLLSFRETLVKYISPLVHYKYEAVANDRFFAHLTLTLGLPLVEANYLKEQAEDLVVNFTADHINFLVFDKANGNLYRKITIPFGEQ